MRVLWGLLLALLIYVFLLGSPASVWKGDTRVNVALEICPAIELRVQVQPLEPVRDPDPTNNVHQQRVFVYPH